MRTLAMSRVLLALAVPCWAACGGDDAQIPAADTSSGPGADGSSSSTSALPSSDETGAEPASTDAASTDAASTGATDADAASTEPASSSEDAGSRGSSTDGSGAGSTGATASSSEAGPTGSSSESTTGEAIEPADAFFEIGTIARLDLVLDAAAVASLTEDPKAYVHGDLTVTSGGISTELDDVAVRLKGNYGSLRTLDQKAAFLINFDHYVDDQRLFGIEKLAVNNMVQDPSMQREALAYRLFREGGVPAPRSAHAVVTVNGEPYGLYATVESTDNSEFLERWFGDDDGNLYEGAYGSDLFTDLVQTFDQDNGDDVAFADLSELATALDAITDPEDFWLAADQVIDLQLFVTFAATEIYLGHWDGYSWTRNNYYVYRRESDGRWVFMPWGVDQTFDSRLEPFGGAGRVAQLCDASLLCRARLATEFEAVVARVDALELAAQAQALADVLRFSANADPRKEYGIDTVDAYVANNIAFMSDRGQEILDGLLCADPSAVDEDGDGYDGCGQDCNDGDGDVHPGAAELCDLDDDDCDGSWDDDPMCPQCVLVALPEPPGASAALCFTARSWADAEADCVEQGGHLIAIHDADTQDFVAAQAFAVADRDWWIGVNDLAQEGSYAWSDASAADFADWAPGEPNNAGEEDCGHLASWAGGAWNDQPCDASAPYVCGLP